MEYWSKIIPDPMQLTAAGTLAYLLLLGSAIFSEALEDAPALRCDVKTVAVGDTQYSVGDACGPPDKITRSGGRTVENWDYNFGPTDFIYYLKFINDRLERIQVAEHGYIEE